MAGIRKASQAGRFYTADSRDLREMVTRFIDSAQPPEISGNLVGFISPHAGYEFSGGAAGHAYRCLKDLQPDLIVVFAPSHYAHFPLASIWDGEAYATPLGNYPIDLDAVELLRAQLPGIQCHFSAELQEHSLEVQVPFLQVACPNAKMIPLVIGAQEEGNIRKLVEGLGRCCGVLKSKIAFLASSDAYHGYSLDECKKSDTHLREAVLRMDAPSFYKDIESGRAMACGFGPIAAVMQLSKLAGATQAHILHQSTSADAMQRSAGDYVVGYLAAAFG